MADSFSVRDPQTGETFQVSAIERVRLVGKGYEDVRASKRRPQQAEAKQQVVKAKPDNDKPEPDPKPQQQS